MALVGLDDGKSTEVGLEDGKKVLAKNENVDKDMELGFKLGISSGQCKELKFKKLNQAGLTSLIAVHEYIIFPCSDDDIKLVSYDYIKLDCFALMMASTLAQMTAE
eukprot:6606845-Ditylum_brightwellii.AAC.2